MNIRRKFSSCIKRVINGISKPNNFDKKFYDYTYDKYEKFSDYFVSIFCEIYNVNSVVDVGCGNGLYLKKFSDSGIDISGFEGSKAAIKYSLIPALRILRFNLKKIIHYDRKFDLCISLEVAEHLKSKYAVNFIKSLTNLSDIIVFSAAYPGQGGIGHYNERSQKYWIELFNKEGFAYKKEKVNSIKLRLEETGLDLTCMYPYINLMIFEKHNN